MTQPDPPDQDSTSLYKQFYGDRPPAGAPSAPKCLFTLRLKDFLSFGENWTEFQVRPLNIMIGANGSGKSNLIDALGILKSLIRHGDLAEEFREGGGVRAFPRFGKKQFGLGAEMVTPPSSSLNVTDSPVSLRHEIHIGLSDQTFTINYESIRQRSTEFDGPDWTVQPLPEGDYAYEAVDGRGYLWPRSQSGQNRVSIGPIHQDSGLLKLRVDPKIHGIFLLDLYDTFRIFRSWEFGRAARVRQPSPTTNDGKVLKDGGGNLPQILNNLTPDQSERLAQFMTVVMPGYRDVRAQVETATISILVYIRGSKDPVTQPRLSDGTMRMLYIAAALLSTPDGHLVAIDEPDMAVHPDALRALAELIIDTSRRCYVIITTHSPLFLSYFDHTPEAIVACDLIPGEGTRLRRLNPEFAETFLEELSLGDAWIDGMLGGTRA